MNTRRDPETTLAAWLDEGPTDLPDATRRAILTALPTTPQARRGFLAPWRLSSMKTYTRLVAVAVAAIAVGGALYLIGPRFGVGGPSQTPKTSEIDGAWQTCPTEADILAVGGDADEAAGNAGCTTLTLRDGVFRETGGSAATATPGTYVVDGSSITIHRSNNEDFAFGWSVVGDTLTLTRSTAPGSSSPAPWIAKPFVRIAGPSPIDGAWKTCPTQADILAVGGDADEAAGNAGCTTLTLRDGVFRETGASAATTVPGRYVVDGATISIHRSNGEVFSFGWGLVGDTLTLTRSTVPGSSSPAPWIAKPFQRTSP